MGEHYSPCPIYFRQTSVSPPNCHMQEGPEIHSLNFLCNLMTSVNIDYLWQSNWLKASSKRSITEQNACYGECWESDREGEWVVHSIRPSIAGRRQWLLMTSDVNIGVSGEVPLHFANYRFDVTIPWNLVPTIWLRIIIFPSGHINHLKTVDYLVLHIQLPLFVCPYWHIFLYFNCWIWVTANRTFFFPSSFIQFFVSFSFCWWFDILREILWLSFFPISGQKQQLWLWMKIKLLENEHVTSRLWGQKPSHFRVNGKLLI